MNKLVYSLFAVALATMSGCQDETVENPVIPAQTGDEITFGSSLVNVQTRTIYGDEAVNDAYPVYWENGDQISIYCPQAAQGNLVTYKITPDETDATHSSAVTKVNTDQAGLQWGKEETHKFSAFYPSDKILGESEGKLKGTIPANQDPIEWKQTKNEAGGTTYTGVANTDYAFMWAYNEHNKSDGQDVSLVFKPWVTILDVEIKGPEKDGEEIKMSSVQLRSLTDETLNGDFLIDFNSVEDNSTNPDAAPTYIPAGNSSATRNQITIQFYNQELNNGRGDFITLKTNDKIVVRFYLLPKDTNYDTSIEGRQDLQIRVTPYNSAVLTRTLNAAEGTQIGGIIAHKVNKVILPSVSKTGPNYWMSSLNPDIYVTELSLPGSRMSSLTESNDATTIYQDQTIGEQFQNGIRAFYFQTLYDKDNLSILNPDYNLYVAVNGKSIGRLRQFIKEIADGLQKAEDAEKFQEFAFVLLTWNSVGGADKGDRWMQAIEEELKEMGNDSQYRIFTEEITPQTTIDKVKGKIIVKVNYNYDSMGNSLKSNAKVPAMFAIWDAYYRPDGNPLRWGSSNHDVKTSMKWSYQEVSTIGNGGKAQTNLQTKKQYVREMFENSIEAYKNNDDHSMWFMNDCGGSLVGTVKGEYVSDSYESDESSAGVEDLAQEMGLYVTQLLQNRTEDATLGIVYLNFANPEHPYSGNLIQTIINNNFNFPLRTDGSAQAETYNATYSNGGNAIGWNK